MSRNGKNTGNEEGGEVSTFYRKLSILPRQARDEHRENSKREPVVFLLCRDEWERRLSVIAEAVEAYPGMEVRQTALFVHALCIK
jgi:hypothetical protein